MQSTKKISNYLTTVAFSILVLAASAPVLAECPAAGNKVGAEKLQSNEYFEVNDASEIKFHRGVDFEVVETKEGKSFLRFDFGELNEGVATEELECKCPDGCWEDPECKITITQSGWAKCRGGCYNGQGACNSCGWVQAQPQ